MLKIAIVILNWNGHEDTLECLDSVGELRVIDFELRVIVVDNASTDDSEQILKGHKLSKGKYEFIVNDENLGFAGGNNVGIRHAIKHESDYVLVLNNDTIVHKNLVVQLIKAAESNMDAALCSPKIYFAKGYEFHKKRYKREELGKVIWYAGGDMDWNNVYGNNHGLDEVDNGQFNMLRETDFASGSCVLIRTGAIKGKSIFDEKYFLYFEDTDLSMRLRADGWKVMYVPKSKLWHKVARSSAIGGELNDYFIIRNRLLFGMRYAPRRAKAALLREGLKLLLVGRKWQKRGVFDFLIGRYGKGSWN